VTCGPSEPLMTFVTVGTHLRPLWHGPSAVRARSSLGIATSVLGKGGYRRQISGRQAGEEQFAKPNCA
jgi:hypothetical protein